MEIKNNDSAKYDDWSDALEDIGFIPVNDGDDYDYVKTSKKMYKSKINYTIEVSKPIMAIFFNFINLLSDKRRVDKESNYNGIEFKGVLGVDNNYVDFLPDYPPLIYNYTAILKIKDNYISINMFSIKEGGNIRAYFNLSSLDVDNVKSEALYNHIFKIALSASNIKGSYLIISDNALEWEISTLKDINFKDVFLPKELMGDLNMYVKLFENKQILPRYMFSGVPGTGKTESTSAICKILNKQNVTIIKTNICKIIKDKFELAKILAPSVIILDDIDLYLGDRNQGGYSPLLGTFLDILDGVNKLPDNVGVIATTNAPHLIDLAAQRPGRFDKLLFFDELTLDNIKSIINKSLDSLNDKYKNVTNEDREILCDDKLVKFFKENGFTGAAIYEIAKDIKNKSEILGESIDLNNTIKYIKKNNDILQNKLKAVSIGNKLKNGEKNIGY